MKLIVIDDERTNCKLLEIYIKRWGYQVDIFSNSVEGYQALLKIQTPVVALVDWMMPDMSGLDICKKIREERPDFPIYIILLTAKSSIEDVVMGLESGADDYVTKPFKSKELKSRVVAAVRVLNLETKLIKREHELEKANKKLTHSLEIIEKDVEAGRKIQTKLLPQNKIHFDGFEFSHLLEPSLYLSGDFLDYYKIDEDYIGFYFIDVAGHGASSAFVTILLKSYISNFIKKHRQKEDDTIISPSVLINKVNQMLIGENLGKHLTLFYGIIDLKKNKLLFSNGGQYPFPILYDGTESKFLVCKSFPVGIMKSTKYKKWEIELPEKFGLYFFSDGVLDILPQKNIKDKEEILLSIIDSDSVTISELKERIQLPKFDEIPDDITFLKISNGAPNVSG